MDAFEEGVAARNAGKGWDDSPYKCYEGNPHVREQHKDWLCGWNAMDEKLSLPCKKEC